MVMLCAAYGCTNKVKKGENRSFHSFPKDPVLCKKWVISTKRKGFWPSVHSKLCSDHFQPDDFVYNFGKKSLKCGVIPTLFNFPAHIQKKKQKQRSKRLETATVNTVRMVYEGDKDINIPSTSKSQQCDEKALTIKSVVITSTRKRKRSQPVFMGDISEEDLENPKKFKRMWHIAKKTIDRQRKTIMFLRSRVKRLQRKINSLQDLIAHLKNTKKISSDCYSLLQECIPNSERQLLLRQLKKSTDRQFPAELRVFALTLQFYSTNAYNYVRKHFGNCLPHPNTIRKWYSTVDGSPGYTAESLRAIKMRAKELEKKGKALVCSLVMDEMSIRQFVEWNGTQNIGHINFGFNIDSDNVPLAKEALVFLIVGVNCNWKIPIAYFLIASLNAEERANLVKGCLIMLHNAGVKIISLTFDGAAANFSMASVLGADLRLRSLKTFFHILLFKMKSTLFWTLPT